MCVFLNAKQYTSIDEYTQAKFIWIWNHQDQGGHTHAFVGWILDTH